MLKVGLIGAGTVSAAHVLGIRESGLGRLSAVSALHAPQGEAFSGLPFYRSYEELLEKEQPDVVHLCLPHHLHAEVAEACLRAGAHVLLEKPLALGYEEGRTLLERSRGLGRKLGICFQNRYNRTTEELLKRLRACPEDAVRAVKGIVTWCREEEYYTGKPWRGRLSEAGAGTIINQSIHTLDLMQLFSLAEIEDCRGQLGKLLDYEIEVEDTAAANYGFLRAEDGGRVSGLYFASNAYRENSAVELEVLTEKRRYVIRDFRLFEYTGGNEPPRLLCEDEGLPGTKSYYGMGHCRLISAFYRSILGEEQDFVTAEEALKSMLMIELLRKSDREGRRVGRKELEQAARHKPAE